ncbi:MAG: hypothetical protein M3Z66_07045 [Chloroflexota bacterium]|nr:hypothetical protein [Chloroflexota bacterium]
MPNLETFRLSKVRKLDEPYITAGDRAYVVGTQDGGFPDMGWHVEGEMGGVWAHPIKLLDGFWLSINGAWLERAERCTSGPFWSQHEYLAPNHLRVIRRQFAPDGEPALVLRYSFELPEPQTLRVRFLARTDLRGGWLSEVEGITDGEDSASYLPELGAWLCGDCQNPWSVVLGARNAQPSHWECGRDLWGPERTRGPGISVALDYEFRVERTATLEIIVAGDVSGPEDALATYARVRDSVHEREMHKAARFQVLLERSRLDIPENAILRAWDWTKCNTDWLVRDVPGVGRGLGAGAPDYVWWFGCDSCYAIPGILGIGQHETAMETLDLIRSRSEAVNGKSGRVLHECTTRGHVSHPGCRQETPHFVTAVWQTTRWAGDRAFLDRQYDFCRRGLLGWTLGDVGPELLPHGYGIIEVAGLDLRCLDVTTHTIAALDALREMAEVMGDEETAERCHDLGPRLREALEQQFWMEEEGLYGDLAATPREMLPRLCKWLADAERSSRRRAIAELNRMVSEAEAAVEPDRLRPWFLGNWTTISPLEAGIARPDRAARALPRIEREFTDRWGVYVNAFDRGPAMSINTGALAVAELAYGRIEEALLYIHLLTKTLDMHMPGAISEISPDEGCFVQAWSGYGLIWPIVTQVFGLQPDALRRHLEVQPNIPNHWPEARLENVRIGDTSCDVEWSGRRLLVTMQDSSWTVSSRDAVPVDVAYSPEGGRVSGAA